MPSEPAIRPLQPVFSRLALAGWLVSLAGFWGGSYVSGIPAVILSILALWRIKKGEGIIRGRWLACASIGLGCVLALPWYLVWPRGQQRAWSGVARGIYQAVVLFAEEHEGRCPQSLQELLPDYLGHNQDILIGPPPDCDPAFFTLVHPGIKLRALSPTEPVIISKPLATKDNAYLLHPFMLKRRILVQADGAVKAVP